eukprot:GEZU01036642.1.p1 GENE.GEZU01036642.1~~GEZU01036642.1.p1  ORF type:complete len:554 (+),score=220.29 GEZU01036642.1:34-1662(+)
MSASDNVKKYLIAAGAAAGAAILGYVAYKAIKQEDKEKKIAKTARTPKEATKTPTKNDQTAEFKEESKEEFVIPAGFTTYDNDKLGIQFMYPGAWEKQISIQHPVFVIKFNDPKVQDENAPNVLVIIEELSEPLDSAEYMEKSKDTIRSVPGMEVEFLSEKETKFGQSKAFELEYLQRIFNPQTGMYIEVKAWNFLTVVGRKAYCIQYISAVDNFDNSVAIDISKTLKITAAKPSSSQILYRESKYGLELLLPTADFRVEPSKQSDVLVELVDHGSVKEKKNRIKVATVAQPDSLEALVKDAQKKIKETTTDLGLLPISSDIPASAFTYTKGDVEILTACFIHKGTGFIVTAQYLPEFKEATVKSLKSISFKDHKTSGLQYKNPEYHFQIDVPATMQIVENSWGEPIATFLYSDPEHEEEFNENDPMTETSVSVKEFEQPVAFDYVVQMVHSEFEAMRQAGQDISVSDQKIRNISGAQALELVYTQTNQFQGGGAISLKFLVHFILSSDGRKLYTVKSYTLEPFFAAPKKKFETIASSFKFL